MKKWFYHPSDINEPLTGAEITGMTAAGTSLCIVQIMLSMFIAYFYTNVAGISAAAVGTLLLITRIADGFTGAGMGFFMSKSKGRWRQGRPWVLLMAFPLFLSVVLAFYIPDGWHTAAKTVYACATFFLLNIAVLTPVGIAGSVLGSNMTVNQKSRQKNAVISSLFIMAGSVIGNVAVLQITQSMGDSHDAWRLAALLFGALASAGQAAQFLLTRERAGTEAERRETGNTSMKDQFSSLVQNKYFIIMCFVGLMAALDGAMAGGIIYYVKYVLQDMELVSVMGAVSIIFMAAGIALTPVIAKKIPAKQLMLAGLAVKIITLAVNVWNPANPQLFIGLTALRSLTGAPVMIYSGVYLLNTIEYGEYKTGIRANHLIVSVSGVWSKIGAGLGGALIGWLLSYGGYDGAAVVQSASAQHMIIHAYFTIPLAAAVIQWILLYAYKLDKEYAHVSDALKQRGKRNVQVRNHQNVSASC